MTTNTGERFSLVVWGPFHAVLHRLGLTGADRLPTQRAALGLALLKYGRLATHHHLAFHRKRIVATLIPLTDLLKLIARTIL